MYKVGVYLVDKKYGGPEEGGWWYTAGELVRASKLLFVNDEDALDYANKLNARFARTLNKGRRSISSVLSTGQYKAKVYFGSPPKYFPQERPYYE